MNCDKLADALWSPALDCIVVSDVPGRIVEFNAAAERTFSRTRHEVVGKLMDDTIPPMFTVQSIGMEWNAIWPLAGPMSSGAG